MKRNQIIVLLLAVMIVAAGYINYSYKGASPFAQEITGNMDERLGDTTLVEEEQNNLEIGYAEPVNKEINQKINSSAEKKKDEKVETNKSTETGQINIVEQFFAETRSEKERVRDQEISLHENVLTNSNTSKETQLKAQDELVNISQRWEKEMVIERLIKVKGFKDAVVFINQGSVNVVVLNGEELKPAQVAQIQDIVMREAKVALDNVKIVVK